MKVKLTFQGEVTIEGNSLKQIKEQWDSMNLFTNEAKKKSAGISDLKAIENCETGEDLSESWNSGSEKNFIIYTDGGYHIPKNEGAFAFVILQNDKIIHKEATVIRNETNNRGELKAIINAVRWCPAKSVLFINSDSQYAINTLKGDWKRNANLDLFKEWDSLLKTKQTKITFNWVKGHSGNKYNELCDKMCDEAVGYDLNSWIPKKK